MTGFSPAEKKQTDTLIRTLARKAFVSSEQILPFADCTIFLREMISCLTGNGGHLISAGHAASRFHDAAELAGVVFTEVTEKSPFSPVIDQVTEETVEGNEVIWMANPSPVTGAVCSLSDLERLADSIPVGVLIVDESYVHFHGVSAIPLLGKHDNIVVLRPLKGPFGCDGGECGFAVGHTDLIGRIDCREGWVRLSDNDLDGPLTCLLDSGVQSRRIKTIYDESKRIIAALNRRGIQPRTSATDFLLIPVVRAELVRQFLADRQVVVEGLTRHKGMEHYLRYRIQSPAHNDDMLQAFGEMPDSLLSPVAAKPRKLHLQRSGEVSGYLPGRSVNRVFEPVSVTMEHGDSGGLQR